MMENNFKQNKSLKWNIWRNYFLILILMVVGYTYLNYYLAVRNIALTAQKELLAVCATLGAVIAPHDFENTIGIEQEEIFEPQTVKAGNSKNSRFSGDTVPLKPGAPADFVKIYNLLIQTKISNQLNSDIYILIPNEDFSTEDFQDALNNWHNLAYWDEKSWLAIPQKVPKDVIDGKNYRNQDGKIQRRRPTVKDFGVRFSVSTQVEDYGNYFPVNLPMLKAILYKQAQTLPLYEDIEGAWVSAMVPILLDDEVLGIIEADYELSHLLKHQQLATLYFAAAGFCVAFVFSIITYLVAARISANAEKLQVQLSNYSAGNINDGIHIDADDEIGAISDVAERMRREVNQRIAEIEQKNFIIEEYSKTLEEKVAERTDELKKALSDTAQARDRIDGIVKAVAEGLIVTDIYNRVVLMNRPAEDLLGVRLSEVIDQPFDFAIRDETLRDRVRSTLEKNETGYEFDFELSGDNPTKPRIMRALTSVIYDKEGRQAGIVTSMHDVTQEREVDKMKTEFISTAAHELRTPLTSIQGFSEIMLTRNNISEEEKQRFLTYINKQALSLAIIVSDLLDIARIESGRGFSLTEVRCNIGDIINQVVPYFQEHAPKHHFEVILSKKPAELLVDKQKMEQVFKNLIDNAVKYSPNGGLIQVAGRLSTDHFEVSIVDQGVGMSSEQVEKIFDKFYRVDASDTAVEGTGLGMTIVKYIVEAHGGQLWVESEPGKGTTVRFALPA